MQTLDILKTFLTRISAQAVKCLQEKYAQVLVIGVGDDNDVTKTRISQRYKW